MEFAIPLAAQGTTWERRNGGLQHTRPGRLGTDNRLARITLNRPEKMNALTGELFTEPCDCLHDVEPLADQSDHLQHAQTARPLEHGHTHAMRCSTHCAWDPGAVFLESTTDH